MKEKIYTIPVNDAFREDCECPVCLMYKKLEEESVAYTMGPSYMEDDIRDKTDRMGFCQKHLKKIYERENRLGFALVMKTHMDRVIMELEKCSKEQVQGKSLFKKPQSPRSVEYIHKLQAQCFVCDRIENTFIRYVDTIFYMYSHDDNFRKMYESCRGFCTEHYGLLIEEAQKRLSGSVLDSFISCTNRLYLENMRRVRDDVAWFINKFDHKYANEPWRNAKDSLTRAMTKDSSIL
ncbi:MAG: DUF6062 family protein [Eubacteriales bacterium]|nr:DUF6062 family protein [Eubacteriales bacterium]